MDLLADPGEDLVDLVCQLGSLVGFPLLELAAQLLCVDLLVRDVDRPFLALFTVIRLAGKSVPASSPFTEGEEPFGNRLGLVLDLLEQCVRVSHVVQRHLHTGRNGDEGIRLAALVELSALARVFVLFTGKLVVISDRPALFLGDDTFVDLADLLTLCPQFGQLAYLLRQTELIAPISVRRDGAKLPVKSVRRVSDWKAPGGRLSDFPGFRLFWR